MDPQRLRQETRAEHESVEAQLSLMSPTLTLPEYRATLGRFYAVMSAWDAWCAHNTPHPFQSLVAARQRTPMLERDLRWLGGELSSASAKFPVQLTGSDAARQAAFLGCMYVVEGSALGGQYIAQHVESALGLEPGVGDEYFRGYGAETGRLWNEFKLLVAAVPDAEAETVIQSAKSTFAFFGAELR